MLETIAVITVGLIPGLLASYLVSVKLRSLSKTTANSDLQAFNLPLQNQTHSLTHDYRYIDGLGYIVGDILCKNNARSPYLRCAINPCGPCTGCMHYEEIEFVEFAESQAGPCCSGVKVTR